MWDGDGVVVKGALPDLLAIVPVDALALDFELTPTAGSWRRQGDVARFVPRFPAAAGAVLAVVSRRDPREAWSSRAQVVVPGAPPVPRATVESIDPRCEEIPANLLRFSLSFSESMEEGSAAGRVSLCDASGTPLPGTLFDMPPELWDRDRRHLTVLLEPGRIKRGLRPNRQAGPPLHEGATVTVAVDSGIRDARGAELAAGAQRSYRVGPALRSRVDPRLWDVGWPEGERDPLVIRFDRPLDRALARRCLRVVDAHGRPVPGSASLDESATVWAFTPAADDGAGATAGDSGATSAWNVQVDTRLEDLAGNSVRRVFDRDLQRRDDDGIDASLVILDPTGQVALKR